MSSFVVYFQEVRTCRVVIEAEDSYGARDKFWSGNFDEDTIVECGREILDNVDVLEESVSPHDGKAA